MEAPPYTESPSLPKTFKVHSASTVSSSDSGSSASSTLGAPGSFLQSIGSNLLSKSCICLHLDNPVYFLCPVPPSQNEPIPETVVSGYAVLNLTTSRHVKSFVVRIIGDTEIGFTYRPWERQGCLFQELSLPLPIDAGTNEVPAGLYSLRFQFKVPGTAAPFQRCKYGRTKHKIVAKAKGAGRLGSSVEAEKVFDVTANAGWRDPQHELNLDIQLEDWSQELGPYRLSMHSNLFVVSGLLSIRFTLPSPPQHLTLSHIRVSIVASWILTSSERDRATETGQPYTETPQPDQVTIALIDADRKPDSAQAVCCDGSVCLGVSQGGVDSEGQVRTAKLARLDPGEHWEMTHLARLPNDDFLRPSTHPNTDTNIRCSHAIVFEVIFVNSQGGRKHLTIKKPVFLSSCCCLLASIMLPSYQQCDPCPENADLVKVNETHRCLCGTSLKDLKSAQDPTKYLDGPPMPEVIVPIKSDEERLRATPAATILAGYDGHALHH